MRKLFQKIPLLITSLLFLFSCGVFIFLYEGISTQNDQLQSVLAKWQQKEDKRNELELLDLSIKLIKKEKEELEEHFVESSDVVPFLNTIEKLANKVGANTEITSADSIENNTKLLVGLNVSGSFEELYKFITLLENSPYELEIKTIDLQKTEQSSGSNSENKISEWKAIIKVQLLSYKK